MAAFYNFFIHLFVFGMRVLSLFNNKAKKGVLGRKESLTKVKQRFNPSDEVIWMHAASLGEYEQGLPVLKKLKEKYPKYKILITFFSPSGYENVVNKGSIADVVAYLPFDKKKNISAFCSAFQTKIFFTVKYDYWYHLLDELKKNGAALYVVSALFYKEQVFFKSYGKWFVEKLKNNIDCFFHQTESSCRLAQEIGLSDSIVSGDTRFDRVKQLRERDNSVEYIQEFKSNKKLIVFGSSWESEEKVAQCLSQTADATKIIIAPHDLRRVEGLVKDNALLYSKMKDYSKQEIENAPILIIDSIGWLSKIYSYADAAVVGGGFHSKGLHNILEAATFGVPVFFGNRYFKNPEADGLIKNNAAKSFSKARELALFLDEIIQNETELAIMSKNAFDFVTNQPDSSQIVINKIGKDISLK